MKRLDKNIVTSFRRGTHEPEFELAASPGPDGLLTPGLTVIICTYKRGPSLRRLFDSLADQDRKPDKLVIVDASPDMETEEIVRAYPDPERIAGRLVYFRVSGPLKGLTRQRNFGLNQVTTDLVGFFDDDVVFHPGCIRELERGHRCLGPQVVGVGACITNGLNRPNALWKARRLFRLVPSLTPGKYFGSGISTPLGFLAPTEALVEVDWLPGCAMTWKTAVVRQTGFHAGFDGYALGEDLDFSLRAGRLGKLVLAGSARLEHLVEPSGRPNHFKMGYMSIYNNYQIHRRAYRGRTRLRRGWFIYAWTLDTLMLARHFLFPARVYPTITDLAGRLKATLDLVRGR